jgi:hypothetical protein
MRNDSNWTPTGLFCAGVCAVALAGGLLLAGSSAVAGMRPATGPQPKTGIYQYASVLTSVNGNCGIKPGLHQSHIFYYPGPSRQGARYVTEGNPAVIAYSTYPATPALGITTWSGTYTQYVARGGQTGSGTFTATLTLLDPDFFTATEVDSQGSCTQYWQGSYIRISGE